MPEQSFLGIVFIFCAVLVLYLHVAFHRKTSSDLTVFVIDETDKYRLETMCDLHQPVLFRLDPLVQTSAIQNCASRYILANRFGNHLVNLCPDINTPVDPIPIRRPLNQWDFDCGHRHMTLGNTGFVEASGLSTEIEQATAGLRPPMTARTTYDIWMAADCSVASSSLRYEIAHRTYLTPTAASVKVRLFPPDMKSRLEGAPDYEFMEFHSPIDAWSNTVENYTDVNVRVGEHLYIPAYWWYSVQFMERNKENTLVQFRYYTYMNLISHTPEYILHFFQVQNMKIRQVPKLQSSNVAATEIKNEENKEGKDGGDKKETTCINENEKTATEKESDV